MKLTQFTDYSLRVLMYLAIHEQETVSISDIARAYDVSENHLMKIVHLLGRNGFVSTTRGRGGGLRLAKPPRQIRIGDVVRKTEPDFDIVECFRGCASNCRISPACVLQQTFQEASAAFLETLDRYTLADLTARSRSKLLGLLSPVGN